MKEIGGYFELEQGNGNKEYYENLIRLNSARNSLIYLCKSRYIKKIYLPYFLCSSVSNALKREKIDYEFYNVDKDFCPIFNKSLDKNEFLYFVNYYGLFNNESIKKYIQMYKNVIVDNVQAFFLSPIEGVDTIYSCRKFFGVPDGSYLSTDKLISEKLEIDISTDRTTHLYGRLEYNDASRFYNDFKRNEESFKGLPLKTMSVFTQTILSKIDYNYVKSKREDNFNYLSKRIGKYNNLQLSHIEGPYSYPLLIDDGMNIKKRLANNKIYVPTLWPNVLESEDLLGKEYAKNILPLPCDQRYNHDDMDRMCDLIIDMIR